MDWLINPCCWFNNNSSFSVNTRPRHALTSLGYFCKKMYHHFNAITTVIRTTMDVFKNTAITVLSDKDLW